MKTQGGIGWIVMGLLAAGCGDDGVATGSGASSTGGSTDGSSSEPAITTSTDPTTGELPTTSGDVTSASNSSTTGEPDPITSTGEPDTTTTTDTTDTTDTTGPACPPASEGCPCSPDDTCDDPLLCVEGVCQPPPPATCGDGKVDDGEECDDADADNTDACLDTCFAASCGDSFVQADVETCDDGNDLDTDDCIDCKAATCGDGFVQADVETCDDANDLDTDACIDCKAATCGDGFVQAGVEACDDGNAVDNDACSNTCKIVPGCKGGMDCLVVASNATGIVSLIDPITYATFDTFPGFTSPLSVAAGPDGKLYVGQSNSIRTVDLVTKAAAQIGNGVAQGPIYGITVRVDKIYATGSGMTSVKLLTLAGVDAGTVVSPNGNNLRSTAFGPQGDFYLSSFGAGPGQRWSPGLVYVGAFGNGSGLNTAFGVTTRSNGDVLISGQDLAAYFVYSQLGVFKKKVAVNCVGQLRNIAADKNDRLYVGCHEASKVVVFDPTDVAIKEVPISTPSGVAVLTALP